MPSERADFIWLLLPAVLLLAFWLYRLFGRYLERGGRRRMGLRGLAWLLAFLLLLAVSVLLMQ